MGRDTGESVGSQSKTAHSLIHPHTKSTRSRIDDMRRTQEQTHDPLISPALSLPTQNTLSIVVAEI